MEFDVDDLPRGGDVVVDFRIPSGSLASVYGFVSKFGPPKELLLVRGERRDGLDRGELRGMRVLSWRMRGSGGRRKWRNC